MIEITQIDRDAFKELVGLFGPHAERADAGEHDADWRMAILARHRQAAEKAQQERDIRILHDRIAIYRGKIVGRNEEADDMRRFAIEALEYLEHDIRSQGHE